jgi:urea transport system substrate-binding protein
MVNTERRRLLGLAAASLGFAASPAVLRRAWADRNSLDVFMGPGPRLKVGLLWSLTGHLSVIEKPSRDVALFWIDEINRSGGVAGFQIEPVIIDARSDMKAYREGILRLLLDDKVLATFGGYTSASRRAVMPLVTLHEGLFYYPTCYEGRECWQHIICTGPIANQQSFDLMPFMVRRYGKRAFFIGSNYVWARESNRNASRWLVDSGGELAGERYVPLGHAGFGDIFTEIRKQQPDWIFSTVVGDSDLYFRRAYVEAGFTPDKLPTASLTTSEIEIKSLGASYGEGHILCAPYFQSLKSEANAIFVDSFLSSRFGESGVTHYNMEETYLSFCYFKKAVEKIMLAYGSAELNPRNLRSASKGMELSADESPEGEVHLDPYNLNSWLVPKIGQFNSVGQIELLWQSTKKMQPMPYLLYPERGICMLDGLHLPEGKVIKAAS